MKANVSQDQYGITIYTDYEEKDSQIELQTDDEVRIVRDACNRWLNESTIIDRIKVLEEKTRHIPLS